MRTTEPNAHNCLRGADRQNSELNPGEPADWPFLHTMSAPLTDVAASSPMLEMTLNKRTAYLIQKQILVQIQVLQNSLSIPKLRPFPILFLAALCGQTAAVPQGAPC